MRINSLSMAKSIDLTSEHLFHNIRNAKGFAIDIGGSLAKVAYSSVVTKRSTQVLEKLLDPDENYGSGHESIYDVSETDQDCLRLHFVKFETKYIETCLDFIRANLIESDEADKSIKVTGGGAYKYTELITSKLGVQVDKEDEMECLINGCNFLLKNIPDEAFRYVRDGNPEYRFQGVDCDVFPYLLVNIGSGVSLCKVTGEGQFERIGGTATGGGTFWGLGSLLTNSREFDELLDLAKQGDHRSVDMLVKDIYGGNYSKLGLGANIIASSFGKAARSSADTGEASFKKEDIASSLLLSISNDIGQIAYLHARLHNLKKIYFGGYFIRGHPQTMHTLTYSINYWTQRDKVDGITPMFLRHEGYLCAIGAFLSGTQGVDKEQYSWGENLAGSSGLQSPKQPNMPRLDKDFSMLEMNRLERPLLPFPLLLDGASYFPDTVDLTLDEDARQYWLNCFVGSANKTRDLASKSQSEVDSDSRADQFLDKYLCRLDSLRQNPCAYGSLTVRTLLDTSTHFLEECRFTDIFSQQKHLENQQALQQLASRLNYLDKIEVIPRHLELALGLLAGNVFDWGAKEVRDILEVNQDFGLQHAQDKLQPRPWLFDDFDLWMDRLTTKEPYRCAVIFCDNSGCDIILGILPFARQLLSMGTNVILCANSSPSLNDVVYSELLLIVKKACEICPLIGRAFDQGRFLLMASGQASPCLDLRLIDEALVNVITEQQADLIVIEGMGRAVHTNLYAAFACDALKVAVIKNKWLANRLGGDMFSVMFKYERARCVTSSSTASVSSSSSSET